MNLPPHGKDTKPGTLDIAGRQRVLIVGANGAGKTRFSNEIGRAHV